jgi:hypothetical protein
MKSWVLTTEEDPTDPENLILTFPSDLLEATGWKEGDTIKWTDRGDGSWQLLKVDNDSKESV